MASAIGPLAGLAESGWATYVAVPGFPIVTAAGGMSSLNGQAPLPGNYGVGTVYETGGIGGRGDSTLTFESSGVVGFGGAAGIRRTEVITAEKGAEVNVIIGVGGNRATAGYPPGDGAEECLRLAWDLTSAVFKSSGLVTIN